MGVIPQEFVFDALLAALSDALLACILKLVGDVPAALLAGLSDALPRSLRNFFGDAPTGDSALIVPSHIGRCVVVERKPSLPGKVDFS